MLKSRDLFAELEKNGNAEQAVKMAAYMKNKFVFIELNAY